MKNSLKNYLQNEELQIKRHFGKQLSHSWTLNLIWKLKHRESITLVEKVKLVSQEENVKDSFNNFISNILKYSRTHEYKSEENFIKQ